VSEQGQVAPRTGFMHNFQQRETVIRVWDPVTEGRLWCVQCHAIIVAHFRAPLVTYA